MSSSSELFSHPEIFLVDHLKEVGVISQKLMNSKVFPKSELYTKISYLIAIAHDFAKATTYFQEMLFDKEKRTIKAKHSFLSAIFGFFLVKHFLIERDLLSKNEYLPIICFIVINSHHGNLPNLYAGKKSMYEKLDLEFDLKLVNEQLDAIDQVKIGVIYKQLLTGNFNLTSSEIINKFYSEIRNNGEDEKPELIEEIISDLKKISREKSIENYFTLQVLFSILIDADKLVASGTTIPERIEIIPSTLIEEYKKAHFGEAKSVINKLREKAFTEAVQVINDLDLTQKKRVLDLTLPTGCGKTLTGLACALKLRAKLQNRKKDPFSPKIIYSLPFLSIIDQNSKILEKVLSQMDIVLAEENIPSNLLLEHHHLAEMAYSWESEVELLELPINQALLLTESWHSEIIITTFVQFFHSLISYKNRTSRKFHNLLNSIIILDEIQSIPQKYWLVIKELLEFLAINYNSWIILMTATKPLIFPSEELISVIKDPNDYFQKFNRMNFSADLEPQEFDDFKDKILAEIKSTKNDIMVVLNTINSCKELYQFIKESLALERENISFSDEGIWKSEFEELYCLSTHIIPKHRLAKIQNIAKNSSKRKIIITTQLIEAGVDISVDKVYRDFAPLDSLIQTAGRCNRNNSDKIGLVEIVLLKSNGRTFCDYIYDKTLTSATMEILSLMFQNTARKMISEQEFTYQSINQYFELMKQRTSEDESRDLLDIINRLRIRDLQTFQLIESRISIPLYIELDQQAIRNRELYEDELEVETGYRRKLVRRKYRKQINEYTISIMPRKSDVVFFQELPQIAFSQFMLYIQNDALENWYDIDIGLNLKKDASINMRIL